MSLAFPRELSAATCAGIATPPLAPTTMAEFLSTAARSISRSIPSAAARMTSRTSASGRMIAAPALCAESAPAAALSVRGMSTTRDVSYNVVGTFVGSVAGVAPSCSPSPLVDPHANGNLASAGVSVDVSGAHTLDSLRNTAPLSSGVVGMSSSKVEEEDEVLGEADSASPYARPTHPYHLDVHDPPAYARRQFGELFGGVDKVCVGACSCLGFGCLTGCCITCQSITSGMSMITVAMRSKLDMATWSSDIVAEREVLLKEVRLHCS